MTPSEFIAQLDALKRRGRPLFVVGGVLVLLIDLAIVLYVFHRYPLRARGPDAAVAYSVGFAACWLAIAGLHLALRALVRRYAPACRTCGARATWKVRTQILVTGHCPSCDAPFFAARPEREARG